MWEGPRVGWDAEVLALQYIEEGSRARAYDSPVGRLSGRRACILLRCGRDVEGEIRKKRRVHFVRD